MGGAVGISVMVFLLTQNTQRMHAALAAHVTPYNVSANPALMAAHVNIHTQAGLAALNGLVTDQGAMVGYIDDFRLMVVLTLLTLPFLLLFRRAKA
jgi:DHA2 family multidrug resistance protein